MTYVLKRVTSEPGSPLRIMLQDKVNGDLLNTGGTFYFSPAGEDGSDAQVNEFVAKAIMGDPGLRVHFTCTPPIDQPAVASKETAGTKRRKAAQAADDPAE